MLLPGKRGGGGVGGDKGWEEGTTSIGCSCFLLKLW